MIIAQSVTTMYNALQCKWSLASANSKAFQAVVMMMMMVVLMMVMIVYHLIPR